MLSRRRFFGAAGSIAAAGLGLGAYARFVEPNRIEFTQQRVPSGWPNFAQMSDLHLRGLSGMHEVIAAELQQRACSFIVITGDSIDRPKDLPLLNDFLSMLPAIPKIAILGNWEHWGHIDQRELARIYERWNGRLLVNDSLHHQGISFVGMDDLVGGKPDLARALSTSATSSTRVLLAHCPAYRDQLPPRERFDLILSGHTHGGQVRLLNYAPFTPNGSGRYVKGWYRTPSPMYVSRGVGTSIMPIRFNCRPEVAIFGAET